MAQTPSAVDVDSRDRIDEDITAKPKIVGDPADVDRLVTWIYEIEVSAADFHDAVGAGSKDYGTKAHGDATTGAARQFVAVGVHENGSGVALVSNPVNISIEK